MANLWQQLESKKITNRTEIEQYLTQKLGSPQNQLQYNLLTELTKKITSYYQSDQPLNYTIYSLVGSITSPEQIQAKKFKEGKRLGQTFYILQIGNEQSPNTLSKDKGFVKFQALQENLPAEKWEQIEKLTIIGQNLVFKYKKWITNKQLLDWQPH